MSNIFEELQFGLMGEISLKEKIQEYFNTNKLIKLDTYHPFDFKSSTTYFEIKTRRTLKDSYKSTIIGKNKFEFAENNSTNFMKFYFIFQFTDGLYYYKYEKNDVNIYDTTIIKRYDRNSQYLKMHILLPNEKLIKIN